MLRMHAVGVRVRWKLACALSDSIRVDRFRLRDVRCHAKRIRVPIYSNPAVSKWAKGELIKLCNEFNLHPDFHMKIKQLAMDGAIPRDIDWIRDQIVKILQAEEQLQLPADTFLLHLPHDSRLLLYADELVPRFQRLATFLGIPAETAGKAVNYCQGLLIHDFEEIVTNLECVSSCLGLPMERVQAVASTWPFIMIRELKSSQAVWRRLRRYLDFHPQWIDELQNANTHDLATVLQADHKRLDRLEYLLTMRYRPKQGLGLVGSLRVSDERFEQTWPRFRNYCLENELIGTRLLLTGVSRRELEMEHESEYS